MPIFVENLGLMGACFAGVGGIASSEAATAVGEANFGPVDAGDRYISAGQGLPSLLGQSRDFQANSAKLAPQSLAVSLRDYQEGFAAEMIRRHRLGQDRGLLVLPTGAGKTISVVETLRRLAVEWKEVRSFGGLSAPGGWLPANWRRIGNFHLRLQRPEGILFVAHRDFLLKQAVGVLGQVFGEEAIGLVQGKRMETQKPVVLASAQTLIGALDEIPKERFGLLVLDEAHHYVPENEWGGVLKHLGFLNEGGIIQGNWPRLLVGMTATPDRLTGSPLLNVFGPEGLVTALGAADLWDRPDKVLLKPQVIEVKLSVSVNDVPGETLGRLLAELFYEKLNRGDRFHHTLVYVNTVTGVGEVATVLNELGIAAEGLTGETSGEEREGILDRFAAGITRVLVNVGVAGEGFDVPSVETVVLAFESESRSRVVQAIGRAMRVDPDRPEKQEWVIDLGGNTRKHRLSIQIREAYEAEGVKLKANGEKQEGREAESRSRDTEKQEAEIGRIEELSLQGEKPVTRFIEESFAKLELTPNEIQKAAYRLGVPSDILFAYANGLRVPPSLTEVINIAREIGDAEGLLHDAWAKEKAAQMDFTLPLPPTMGEKTKEWVRYLRYCLWHRHEGVISRVRGMRSATVQQIVENGNFFGHGSDIWEKRAERILTGFMVSGRTEDILGKLNGYLEEIEYPYFEEWMLKAEATSILIFRLQQLAQKLGHSPTVSEVEMEKGMPAITTFKNIFGRFNRALELAGLKTSKNTEPKRKKLIDDLKALAEKLGHTPTMSEVNAEEGMASASKYSDVFRGYNAALKAAKLKLHWQPRPTREKMISDIQSWAKSLGRSPKYEEFGSEDGMASRTTYIRVFGSFNKALIAAGLPARPRQRPY